jgi:hypothetical protein
MGLGFWNLVVEVAAPRSCPDLYLPVRDNGKLEIIHIPP